MEPIIKNPDALVWLDAYANIRSDGYVLLASLLEQPPAEDRLGILQNLQWDQALPEKLDQALRELCRAAAGTPPAVLTDEFNKLFVGLGCGEVIPYASWYRERKIQAMPLVSLRTDLLRLGLVRQADSHESEDHAGAVCEIMALITGKPNEASYETQADFFRRHVAFWMADFFRDLQAAKNAGFYRTVGGFGLCFLECESQYLKCDLSSVPEKKRKKRRNAR